MLDTGSGIDLLEGHLSSALAHWLKGEKPRQIIAQSEDVLETLDAAWELDQLRRRGLVDGGDAHAEEPSIVLTADYLDPRLEHVNREALQSGRPWMLARTRGPVVWVGPVFVPGRGACWSCLAARLGAVRAAWQLPERRDDEAPVTQIGVELAMLEAARWSRDPDSPARLLTFDTRSLAQQSHAVVRSSGCAACGDPSARRSFRPLVLQSRRKAFTADGGHRAAAPEETYARYEHLVSPLTGVVHDVQRAWGDAGSLNVFVARHNYRIGRQEHPGRSFGKGMTSAQARTGALCEALERFSGTLHGDEPFVRATFRDLGDEAVHPHTCLNISERQYRGREEWNRDAPPLLWLPEPFDETRETEWVPAWSLTGERRRYVAAAYCHYGHRAEHDFARADSNGNAAGTCVEDAVLQGLLELVERDAAGIWWYSRLLRPAVTVDTPYVQTMTREHASRGRRLWLLDLTTDLGIPVCAALSMAGDDAEDLFLGFGAHLDPSLAVTRAVSEVNQLLAVRRSRRPYHGQLTDAAFLQPHGWSELATAAPPSDDLRADVLACVDLLRRLGHEVIVLDQTREEIGLPVVKVIVPGLRHFRPRFAPGRLYDVPPRLGCVDGPLREEELNRAHLVI